MDGKVYTFQKGFDDYDDYQKFVGTHPEYSPESFLENFWNPWSLWDNTLLSNTGSTLPSLPIETRHLPEGVDLEKYEKRRAEKKQTEAEKIAKKQSLERTEAYLRDYIEENPDDSDAKSDLVKIEQELEGMK